jgi:hypothetical protein
VDKELERWLDAAFKEIEPCISEMTASPKIRRKKEKGPAMPTPVNSHIGERD